MNVIAQYIDQLDRVLEYFVPISECGFGFGMSFVFRNEVGHCVPP